MYLRFCVLVEIFYIVDYLPLQIFVVSPSKKEVFRRMLVDEPTKKFLKTFFEKNSPARSFCATTRYHPFPELGERVPNVFSMAHIAIFPYLGKKTINEVLSKEMNNGRNAKYVWISFSELRKRMIASRSAK